MGDSIAIERATKRYAGGRPALDDLWLTVESGEFLVVLGPSGSGKTTLLRCVAGIEHLTTGRIDIAGRIVADDGLHLAPERRNLAMVFQDYGLWPHLTVRDNVAFALRRRKLGRSERSDEASRMLELVGLGELRDRYPNELSGGEQQRVALARALAGRTGLILCDEPLSNLDADLRERMRLEIAVRVRAAEATAVYITHDQSEAFALADRVAVLERGRLVQLDTPETVYRHPASPFVARFTGLAAEICVRVERSDEKTAEAHAPGSGLLRAARGRHIGDLRDDSHAMLAIRPTGVRLVPADDPEKHLEGVVTDVAFRDRGYECAVETASGIRLSGIFSPRRMARHESVGISLLPDGCLLFPRSEADAAKPTSLSAARHGAQHTAGSV